jgi:hypothetical protein
MNNVEHILFETIKVLVVAVAGGFIGARINDKFARKRSRDAGIMSEKLKLIPILDNLIDTAFPSKNQGLLGSIRREIRPRLYEPSRRFRIYLKGERLRLFNEAWETLANTTREEVENRDQITSDAEFNKMQITLQSRLEAFRKIVQET